MARRQSNPNDVTSFDDGGKGASMMSDFGFHGSLDGHKGSPASKGMGGGKASKRPAEMMQMGGGGNIHPHGNDVMRVEQTDEGVMHHHAHGGYTMHHMDGAITHHTADGGDAAAAAATPYRDGGTVNAHPHGHSPLRTERMMDREVHRHSHGGFTVHYDDGRPPTHHGKDGTPAYRAGGDVAQDKAMVKKGIAQHETQEHGGKHAELHLARGGRAMHMPSMKPTMPHKGHKASGHKSGHKRKSAPMNGTGALTQDSAVNSPPMDPNDTPTPRNIMPGGQMGYGVQPSSEPDVAGSDQTGMGGALSGGSGASSGATGMRRGGRARA